MDPRRADRHDLARLARTGMRAFAADPLMRWLEPDDARYFGGVGELLQRSVATWWLAMGEVWTTNDGVAFSVWGPPETGEHEPPAELVDEVATLRAGYGPDMIERVTELRPAMAEHRPVEPHWYLNVLATHPDWQRQGLGTLVMRDVVERCDRDRVGQYLETATDEDIAYYRARGFEITDTWIVGGSVTMTGMWRDPR